MRGRTAKRTAAGNIVVVQREETRNLTVTGRHVACKSSLDITIPPAVVQSAAMRRTHKARSGVSDLSVSAAAAAHSI